MRKHFSAALDGRLPRRFVRAFYDRVFRRPVIEDVVQKWC